MDTIGNSKTDGTAVVEVEAQSQEFGSFTFAFFAPKDVRELKDLLEDEATAKEILRHVVEDLKTDARGKAWGLQRTLSQKATTVNGKTVKVSSAVADEIAALRKALAAAKAAK